ncbi:hypothetical protein KRP22_005217 [Phytophthora ramorum]|nr:hypothetical protein KRP22_12801 [Phytophthora ramorum]
MTSVVCDDDEEGLCYLQIESIDEVNNITVWNNYLRPPAYQNSTFYYRSGMLQTWNKFCFQGGMLEPTTTTWRIKSNCTIPFSVLYTFHTGVCNADTGRCECTNEFWGGPRCTFQLGATTANGEDASEVTFGPPLYAGFIVLGIVLFLTIVVFIVMAIRRRRKLMQDAEKDKEFARMTYVVTDIKKTMAASSNQNVFTPNDMDDDGTTERKSLAASGPYHRFR